MSFPAARPWPRRVQIKDVLLTLMQALFNAFAFQSSSALEMYWYRDILWPKSIADTLLITLFRSIGDN